MIESATFPIVLTIELTVVDIPSTTLANVDLVSAPTFLPVTVTSSRPSDFAAVFAAAAAAAVFADC